MSAGLPVIAASARDALLAQVVLGSRLGVVLLDGDGSVTWANAQAEQLLGKPDRGQTNLLQCLASPPHDPQVLARLQAAIGAAEVVNGFELPLADGSGRWLRIDLQRLDTPDSVGPVACCAAALADVTALRTLRELQDRDASLLREAAHIARVGAWDFDAMSRTLRWSDETCLIHEVPPDHVPSLETSLDFYDAASRPRVAAVVAEALRSGRPFDIEAGLITAAGRVRRVRAIGNAQWRDGAVVRIAGVFQDVTEQAAARHALAELADRMRLANEAAQLGVWEWRLDPWELRWDAQMNRLHGRPPVEGPVGRRDWGAVIDPDDRARVGAVGDAVIRGDAVSVDLQYRVTVDGEVRHLRTVGRQGLAGDGARRMIGIVIDVTDRERAAQALLDKAAAERANRAKSEFLSRVSHELRTPLNGILGFAQLLEYRAAELPAGASESVRQIRGAGDHLLALINEMLDLAAIEAGRARLNIEPVALEPLVRNVLELTQPSADTAGVRLSAVQPHAALPRVRADPTRLRQVLLNLLSNAVKYNRPGGSVTLAASVDTGAATVRLTVADDGPGLDAAQREGLFQPFNRLGAETGSVPGSGLGLAISRQYVEAMGGRLGVDSELGQGTRAWAELPAEPAAETPLAAEPAAAAAAAAAAPAIRVLYVEDNAVNALLVRETLAACGQRFALRLADTGEAGVQMALAEPPDVALLDINLPGIDGHEVLARLRAHPLTASLPCAAVSADALPERRKRALKGGFDAYWLKPLDIKSLPARIEALAATRPSGGNPPGDGSGGGAAR